MCTCAMNIIKGEERKSERDREYTERKENRHTSQPISHSNGPISLFTYSLNSIIIFKSFSDSRQVASLIETFLIYSLRQTYNYALHLGIISKHGLALLKFTSHIFFFNSSILQWISDSWLISSPPKSVCTHLLYQSSSLSQAIVNI